METRTSLNRAAAHGSRIGKENLGRGSLDLHKLTLAGGDVKRQRLSDITNTVSSSAASSSASQFCKDPEEAAPCGVTAECVTKLIEENATLMKALGERNKIIELSSLELQKLRSMLEKANQQNWVVAQTNSEMLRELNSSKERLKKLEHELGCTLALLRLKNSELNEKGRLIEELTAKIRVQVADIPIIDLEQAHSTQDSIACKSDGNFQLNEEKLDTEDCEKTRTEEEQPTCAEVATSPSSSIANAIACNLRRRHTLTNQTISSSSVIHRAEEKTNVELHDKMADEEELRRDLQEKNSTKEEHAECAEAANDASLSNPVDNNLICKPTRKRILRSQSLPAAPTGNHQAEVKEKETRRKSSRRRSNNQTSEANESDTALPEIEEAGVLACPADQAEPSAASSHQMEARGRDTTTRGRRRSSRRRSDNPKSAISAPEGPISEPPNEGENPAISDASMKHEEENPDKDHVASSSQSQAEEPRRTSFGRPTRRAAGKVISYKEMPLKTKLRRPE